VEAGVRKRKNIILAECALEAPIKGTASVGVTRVRIATCGDTSERAGEPIEDEDKTANETNSNGKAKIQFVINICSLERMQIFPHQTGEVENVKKCHLLASKL